MTPAAVPEKARHYGLSAMLPKPVDPAKNLVLQYEVKLPPSGLTCGGAYLKFLTASPELQEKGLESETPYSVMFGPDKCGVTNKVHLILKHKNQKTGDIEEKHLRSPPTFPNDNRTHVFTAELDAEANTYRVLVDWEEKRAGKLSEDFDPAFDPPAMISDPTDSKPENWVDAPEIADPTATKPDDWDEDAPREVEDMETTMPEGWLEDEPAEVDDPDARRPEDWDEEEDGDWEPPTVRNPRCAGAPGCGPWKRPRVPNPAYKGPWTAPMVANPDYKGVWSPREIANPAYFVDEHPLAHIGEVGAVALEIWTMDSDYYFDNVVVSNDFGEAAALKSAWEAKYEVEEKQEQERLKNLEAERKQADDEDDDDDEQPTWHDNVIEIIFDHPLLEPYADTLAPVRRFFESRPMALPALVGTAAALLLGVLMSGLRGKGAQRR
ncbi:calreticulin, partial [Helicosporidium sp. ATCC 50920]